MAITSIQTSYFSHSTLIFVKNSPTINHVSKQSSLPITLTNINETNSLNETNSYFNFSSTRPITDPISTESVNFTAYEQPDLSQFFFSLPVNTNQGQMTGLDTNLPITDNNTASTPIPISLDSSEFSTYTYGGYSVQPSYPSQFNFSFPDNTNQGQLSGSDALTLNTYKIQKLEFDAAFNTPKIGALGFDEMVIFATSDTLSYKGTEFGIRMDLKDGFIFGYVQEPSEYYGEVNFQMLPLTFNDGIIHHYTLITSGSNVSFYIDGIDYGNLSFSCNNDYSNFTFSIIAVVHRFSDGWDSNGDNMMVGNFTINQQ
jgi:hypothetical protein